MRISSLIFYLSLIFILPEYAQSIHSWFPSSLNVQPFEANFYEPKAGTSFNLNGKFLRLDIGTTQDIYSIQDSLTAYSFGADLFTYTRLRSENDFKFPVETIDYFFGVNFGYKHLLNNGSLGFRFRLSHVSAHLVDGLYDGQNSQWHSNLLPFVFSKEFFELFPFYQYKDFRTYLGVTYIFHVIPDKIGKGIFQFGFEYYSSDLSFANFTPFTAADIKFSRTDKYHKSITASVGLKFGEVQAKGFSMIFSYYDGLSLHGELFNYFESYSTLGFNVDL